MKTTLHVLTFGLLTIFFSCGQPNEKKNVAVATIDSLLTNFDKKERERLEKRKQIEEQDNPDSIRLDKILQDALKKNSNCRNYCTRQTVDLIANKCYRGKNWAGRKLSDGNCIYELLS
jgi:hypothetical protein